MSGGVRQEIAVCVDLAVEREQLSPWLAYWMLNAQGLVAQTQPILNDAACWMRSVGSEKPITHDMDHK